MSLRGYDWDRTVFGGDAIPEPPFVIISGRTFLEYTDDIRQMATQVPVYIRGAGQYGDHDAAGHFKAMMINHLGVTEFHEDRDDQIAIIEANCPDCRVIKH